MDTPLKRVSRIYYIYCNFGIKRTAIIILILKQYFTTHKTIFLRSQYKQILP